MTDLDGTTCVRCGAPLPADGPAGLCPLCLPPDTRDDQIETPPGPSSSREEARRKRTLASALAAIGAFLLSPLGIGWWGRQRAGALFKRGVGLYDQGKLEEAVADFRTAIRLWPDFAEAHNDFDSALRDQGKLEESRTDKRCAEQCEPG